MQVITKLGVWMDHSSAQLIEYTGRTIQLNDILSEYSCAPKDPSFVPEREKSQLMYYKKLAELIENYKEVILFGPTDAKVNLFNLLIDDSRFSKIKIDLNPMTENMTENQKHSFVKKYFKKAS